jgi:hypothetical protein
MTNLTRNPAPRPIMKAEASKQQTKSVTTTLPSWYKTEKDNSKRNCDYIKNEVKLAQDAMVR